MKKFFALIISVAMLCSMIACSAEAGADNEIYVIYTDGSDAVIFCSSAEEAKQLILKLSEDEGVLIATPNYRYEADALSTTDEYVSRQWALSNDGSFFMEDSKNEHPVFDTPFGEAKQPGQWKRPRNIERGRFRGYETENVGRESSARAGIDINLEGALKSYSDSGKEITVAFVDTGIDITHAELSDRIWINTDEIANNGKDDDGNGYVDDINGWNFYNNTNRVYIGSEDDHGTHGAGTVAAKFDNGKGIAGITQSANIKIMPVKALGGRNGSGSTASIIRAIQYAEKNGAQICNLSLGTPYHDRALYHVIANSKMLFVVAAGNDARNTDISPSYPAAYDLPNIISVANISYDGRLHESSNYGATSVDLAAPGAYILSTSSSGGYSYMTGTSMSAPMVSGAAALVLSHFGDKVTLADVREIIIGSAKKLESLSGSSVSGGMLDIGAALATDVENLQTRNREEKELVEYKGSAPKISVSLIMSGAEQYLQISLRDAEGDASKLKYAGGACDAKYFEAAGTELELDERKMATVRCSAGTFTFWASDEKGNTAICTVTVREKEEPSPWGERPTAFQEAFEREFEEQEALFREIANRMIREFFR